jgi:iron complex transport system substrate-binding protein
MKNIIICFLITASFILCAREYKRVVSLSPAVTEMIYAIGAENKLVARSSACDYPQDVKKIPVAGALGIPAPEKILMLKADLVVTDITAPQSNWDILKKSGIKIVKLESGKLSDYCRNVTLLGALLGRKAEAQKECKRFQDELHKLSLTRPDTPVNVLLLFGMNPLVGCNKNCFADEVLILAGAKNITRELNKKYFVLSTEYVAKQDPQMVILTGMSGDFRKYLLELEAWKNLSFIRNNAIIDNIPQELLCRLSPRTPEGIKAVRNAVSALKSKEHLSK